MTTIRKRSWTSPAGEERHAWLVDYRDGGGARRSKQFARKKDAEAWITQAAWEVSRGVHTADSQSITVGEAAELWIAKAEAEGRERSTTKQYRELARLHIRPLIGNERLSRLSMPAVERFRDALVATRSKAMAGKAVRALSMILTEAQRRGLVAQNVAKGVKVVRPSRERARILIPNRDELRAIIQHAADDLRPLVMTAIFTGLRASELRGLRWADINLKASTLTVSQRADRWGDIGAPKTEAGTRSIPLPPAVVTELRAWKLRAPIGPLGLAFPAADGNVQSHANLLRQYFWPLQIRAGVADDSGVRDSSGRPIMKARYSLHALRHAAASAWIRQGIDLKRLKVWMGHSSIQITIDTYGHLIADATGDAALAAAAQAELLA